MDSENNIREALRDRYEILSVIGRGGMATVYKAVQSSLNRVVALKVVHPSLANNREFIDRFLQEARVCASFNHSGIVTIYDFGSIGSIYYISMEYLDGLTLRELTVKKGKLTVNDTIKFITPIAEVLDYIHKKGKIHRDIKSSNIFITKDRRVVLMDFGIVFSEDFEKLSYAGEILGTPEYMSPEQAEGNVVLDGRSDIYSLGVVIFECLTGKLPFQSNNHLSTLNKVIKDRPPLVSDLNPDVPKWLVKVVSASLTKDRNCRIQSGSLLAKALQTEQFNYSTDSAAKQPTVKPGDKKVITKEKSKSDKPALSKSNLFLIYLIIIICVILVIIIVMINAPSSRNNSVGPPPGNGSVIPPNNKLTNGNTSSNLSANQYNLTDIEGNSYSTVQIGLQTWMAENLRVRKYNDGISIRFVADSIVWGDLSSPGYCWYNNDGNNYKPEYGALYNWYAVRTGLLCPSGWHVPSNDDWTALVIFLGGEKASAPKLKESGISHWNSPNSLATNESGFFAIPAGYRDEDGFNGIGSIGLWWSSTIISTTDTENAWGRFLSSAVSNNSNFIEMKAYPIPKKVGVSVRCIKD